MRLEPGSRLNHYAIAASIGAGGMGEVYRATDTKLDRDVAIKVLPTEVAQDPARLARFEREAKLLAALNHPSIAHVYGFESATLPDGSTAHFLAMELVEGEDLLSFDVAPDGQRFLLIRNLTPAPLARVVVSLGEAAEIGGKAP